MTTLPTTLLNYPKGLRLLGIDIAPLNLQAPIHLLIATTSPEHAAPAVAEMPTECIADTIAPFAICLALRIPVNLNSDSVFKRNIEARSLGTRFSKQRSGF